MKQKRTGIALTDWDRLASLSDDDIRKMDEQSRFPKTDAKFWQDAKLEHPKPKVPITIRLDAEIVDWFRSQVGKGYQTQINSVLRHYVEAMLGLGEAVAAPAKKRQISYALGRGVAIPGQQGGVAVGMATVVEATPAVPIAKSITPEYLICLEDGKKLKMLKRHLRVYYDMTPDEYRERWGLSADYPMVAPKYSEKRRMLMNRRRRQKKGVAASKPA